MAFNFPGVPKPETPPTPLSLYQWAFQAYAIINRLLLGKLNCTGDVTFTASATSTALLDPRLTAQSFIYLMPRTANAANALTTAYFTGQGNGTATINHASDATTDRQFRYLIIG